jgi:hypothetical protein
MLDVEREPTRRTVRVAILGASPCDRCVAACCKQNGHEFAALLRGDDEVRRFSAFSIAHPFVDEGGAMRVERVLPYVAGRCQFLGRDDRCTIYDDRPRACRQFECAPQFNADGPGRHGPFMRRNPHVLTMLESL